MDDLATFIVDSHSAYRIAQQPSLKKLLENVSGRKISMPTPKQIVDTIGRRFEQMKSNLISILNKQKYVCCTCDVWTSQAKSFLGITVHYIDRNYDRHSYVLAFRELKQKQSYEYLGKVISDVFKEYGISVSKITHVVTDGGSAFCKSFRVYGRRSVDEYIEEVSMPASNEDEEIDRPENGIIILI